MPELPEVETVRQGLKLKVLGKVIKDVRIYHDGISDYCRHYRFSFVQSHFEYA